MRTTPRGKAAVLASTLLLVGTLAACSLPGGGSASGCDTEPNDVRSAAQPFVHHASSCNNRPNQPSDTDFLVQRIVVGGIGLTFTCTTPTGVSPTYDLEYRAVESAPVTELGEGMCTGAPVALGEVQAGLLYVIIGHGGVNNQRADVTVAPTL